ncbi:hypothetical protein [Paenibacillus harenae]|uniref:hypothetical protein n=1 Tax=Paenibacillus harenae TaxID=306543 RepID=UPI0012EB45FE|nr:hypothetical protein [Paenibacillus harenae]
MILLVAFGGSFYYFTTYHIPKSTVKKVLEQSINDIYANIPISEESKDKLETFFVKKTESKNLNYSIKGLYNDGRKTELLVSLNNFHCSNNNELLQIEEGYVSFQLHRLSIIKWTTIDVVIVKELHIK